MNFSAKTQSFMTIFMHSFFKFNRFIVDPSFTGVGGGGPTEPGSTGTGMLKLRNIRSGFGDISNAVRLVQLHQLHQLEKEYASKARPR